MFIKRMVKNREFKIKQYPSVNFYDNKGTDKWIRTVGWGEYNAGNIIKRQGEYGMIPYVVVLCGKYCDPSDMCKLTLYQVPTLDENDIHYDYFSHEELLRDIAETIVKVYGKYYDAEHINFEIDKQLRKVYFEVRGNKIYCEKPYELYEKAFMVK